MKTPMMRIFSLMFCAVLLFGAIPLEGFAAWQPGYDDLAGCDARVESPDWYNWLDSYETKYVKTKHGVRAYLRFEPSSDSDYYAYVYEKDQVTVLARQNGFSLVKVCDGTAGWVTSSVLVDRYPGMKSSGSSKNTTSAKSNSPGYDDMAGCNERVAYPDWDSWLSRYETKYVKTKHGVRAYLRYEPSSDSDHYGYVYEKDKVTILARQNGFSLVKSSDGVVGWVTSSVLVNKY